MSNDPKYTPDEYLLMFTFDVAAYVENHNRSAPPDQQLPTSPQWCQQWESAYQLERARAAERLARVYHDVNGHPMPTAHTHGCTLVEIQDMIASEIEHGLGMEHIRAETSSRRAARDAARAEELERQRFERVLLGLEQPRAGDQLPGWAEHELMAERMGWDTHQKKVKKNGK